MGRHTGAGGVGWLRGEQCKRRLDTEIPTLPPALPILIKFSRFIINSENKGKKC